MVRILINLKFQTKIHSYKQNENAGEFNENNELYNKELIIVNRLVGYRSLVD